MENRDSKKKRSAISAATDYLSYRMRTCKEVRDKLREKEYSEEEIEEAIEILKSHKYLDDYDYAVRYFEYSASKKRGAMRATRELSEKGVDSEIISNAYEDYQYENQTSELELALEIAHQMADGEGEPSDKLIARVARRLESRGFRSNDIYKVMAEMRSWKDTYDQ